MSEEKTFADEVRDQLDGFKEEIREEVNKTVLGAISQARAPKKEKRPPIKRDEREGERFTFQKMDRVMDAQDHLYRRMSKEVRQIRNPKTDAIFGEWFRARRWNDYERMRKANLQMFDEFKPLYVAERSRNMAELKRMDERGIEYEADSSYERALYDVGAVDADSGYAAGEGGPLIPLPLASLIILERDKNAKIRARSQVFTSSATTIRVPGIGRGVAAIFAESAGAPEGAGTPVDVLLEKHKLGVKMSATDEALDDSAFNLVSVFTERAGSAIGAGEDVEFTKATLTAITEDILGTATPLDGLAATLDYALTLALYFNFLSQYRSGSTWVGSDATLQILSGVVDTAERPLFLPGGTAAATPVADATVDPGVEGFVFGKQVIEAPLADGVLYIGNLGFYGVLDGGGIRVQVDPTPASGKTDWYFYERVDGADLLTEAHTHLINFT